MPRKELVANNLNLGNTNETVEVHKRQEILWNTDPASKFLTVPANVGGIVNSCVMRIQMLAYVIKYDWCGCLLLSVLMLCHVPLATPQCLANKSFGSLEITPMPRGVHWMEVESSSRLKLLQMIADQCQSNYERLRTYQGTYAVRLSEVLSEGYVRTAFSEALAGQSPTPLIKHSEFLLTFAIDMDSDKIYRFKKPTATTFVRAGSNDEVKLKNVRQVDGAFVVTPEHYLRFSATAPPSTFAILPDHPEAQQKRAAVREATEAAQGQGFADLMDPRDFFSFSDHAQTFAQELNLFTRAMRGESRKRGKDRINEILTVYGAESAEGIWCRLVMKMRVRGDPSYLMTTVWSPLAGYHPVSFLLGKDESGKEPIRAIQWQWELSDGIYVPTKVVQSHYSLSGTELSYRREVEINNVSVNKTLAANQFDYQGMGMKDGDIILDKLESAVYVIRDGEVEKLANFGDIYVAPRRKLSSIRSVLTLATIVVIGVLLFFIWRRRASVV